MSGREVGESLSRLGLGITAGVAVPLGLIIREAKNFESAFANVVKTVEGFDVDAFGELNEGAQEFRDSLLDLSTEIPVVADDLAKIASIGGQFGVKNESLLEFTETVAKLGVAVDGIEAETAAAALAQIDNVVDRTKDNFTEFANVLVDLGNKGNSTEADILEFAKRLAGAGAQAGLSGAEIFGLGAAMANVGLNAEAGGTAMSRLLSQMSRAGAEGAEASQKFADFAGRIDTTVSSGQAFAALFEKDASRALDLFFSGLSDAAAKGQNLNVILSDLGVNEVRQRDTTLRLAGAQGELAKQFDLARKAAEAGTALNEEARKKFATFDNQLKLFLNSIKLVAIEFGTPLLSSLRSALDAMKPVTDQMVMLARRFAELPPVVHTATLALGAGTGLAGILLFLGGNAIKAASDISRLVTALRSLSTAQATASLAQASTGIASLGTVATSSTANVVKMTSATTAWGYSMQVAAPAATTAATTAKGFGVAAAGSIAGVVALGLAVGGVKHYIDEWLATAGKTGAALRVLNDGFVGVARVLRDSESLWTAIGEAASRVGAVLSDVGVIVRDRVVTAIALLRSEIKPLTDAVGTFATKAADLGSALVDKVQAGLVAFKAIVMQVVPGVSQMATAVAFVTGKTSEWEQSLRAQADRIREANGQLPRHTADIKLAADATAAAATAAADNTDALAKSRTELDRLHAAVRALNPEQRALIDGWRAAGLSADEIAKKTHIAEGTVTAYIAAADRATKSNAALAKETAVASDAFVRFAQEGVASVEKQLQQLGALDIAAKGDDIAAAMLKLNMSIRGVEDSLDIRKATQGLSKDLTELVRDTRAFQREMEDLAREANDAEPELRAFYDRLIELKEADFAQSLEASIVKTDEFQALLHALNPALFAYVETSKDAADSTAEAAGKTKDWTTALSGIAQAFGNLKDLGGAVGFAAEFVAQADVALQSFGKVREGIREFAKGAKADLVSAFSDMAAGIAGGLAGVIGATDPSKDLGDRLLGGAIQGASLGASAASMGAIIAGATAKGAATAGVWGAAAGIIVGIMIAVFRGRKTRREMEIVGEEWGTSISKGLYEKIKKAQDDFGGDRVAASLFNFSDILTEAGGLNDLNFDEFTGKLRDIFVMLDTGKFTTEQALHVMSENFDAFASHVVESGELASDAFLELLDLNSRSGLNAPEIAEFIGGRSAAIGTGLAAMLGPVAEGAAIVGQRVRDAFSALDKLSQEGKQGSTEWKMATTELNEALRHQREVASGAIGDLENIGFIAVSTFARARASGLSFVEALNAIGPALDVLIQAQRDFGLEGENAAINQLMHYRELANQFPVLVNAASALAPTLLAIQQSGGLTAEALAAMEDQGLRTFNRLRDAGFTQNEALAQMAEFLRLVRDAHKRLNTPIDENTQALIDQAEAAGVLGEEAVSATDQQRRGFELVTKAINQLIVTLGGVPIAIDDISQALDDIPTDIDVRVNVELPDDFLPEGPWQGNPFDPAAASSNPFGDPAASAPAFQGAQAATAGATRQTINFNVDGETIGRIAVEHGPEQIDLYV